MDADQRIARLAARQHGLFTRSQALDAGVSPAALRGRVAKGRWTRVHAHVFRIAGAPPTWNQALFAAWLASGPGAVLSHRAAATLWELPGVSPAIEISVPSGRCPSPAGVRIHRTQRLERIDVATRGGLDVTSPTRTVLDLSATLDRDRLQEMLDSCLGRHLSSVRFLRRRLDAIGGRGRAGTALLHELLDARLLDRRAPESEFERRLLELLAQLPEPLPVPQYEVRVTGGRVFRLDAAYPDVMLAIEADSYRHHSSATDWAADHTRRNALIADGWRILPVTWQDLCDRPRWLLDLVTRGRAGEPCSQPVS